jgi:hypothetical protein
LSSEEFAEVRQVDGDPSPGEITRKAGSMETLGVGEPMPKAKWARSPVVDLKLPPLVKASKRMKA